MAGTQEKKNRQRVCQPTWERSVWTTASPGPESRISRTASVVLLLLLLFVGCLTSQQHARVSQGRICCCCLTSQRHASVSQGRIYSDNFTVRHTEIEAAGHTFCLTRSQHTDTGPTSPTTDPITSGAWSANFEVTGRTRPRKIPSQAGFEPWIFRSRGIHLNHWASEAVHRWCSG